MREARECPVFYPTLEEFADPLAFIEGLSGQCRKFGAWRQAAAVRRSLARCRLRVTVPAPRPPGWCCATTSSPRAARRCGRRAVRATSSKPRASTCEAAAAAHSERGCLLGVLVFWLVCERALTAGRGARRRYTLGEYEKMANAFLSKRFHCAGALPPRLVECEYWREFLSTGDATHVEYGSDVEGSGTHRDTFCVPRPPRAHRAACCDLAGAQASPPTPRIRWGRARGT
eukprot:scaffold1834_cov331-Prasinococcus_capsulatus_cf.AAC.7